MHFAVKCGELGRARRKQISLQQCLNIWIVFEATFLRIKMKILILILYTAVLPECCRGIMTVENIPDTLTWFRNVLLFVTILSVRVFLLF